MRNVLILEDEGNRPHHPVSCLAFTNLRLLVSLKCDLFPCCTGKERRENKSCVALKTERAPRPSPCQGMGLLWKKTNEKKVVKSCHLNKHVGGRHCLESKALFLPIEQMFMGKRAFLHEYLCHSRVCPVEVTRG